MINPCVDSLFFLDNINALLRSVTKRVRKGSQLVA